MLSSRAPWGYCASQSSGPRTKHVKRELAETMFKVGQVIDPATGKCCAGTTYLESPVSLETTHLTKNLEELDLSSTQ